MKERFVSMFDMAGSNIDSLALSVSTNNYLETPESYEEAFAIYIKLLGMCDDDHELVDEPLRRKFIYEVQGVSPIVIAQKIRNHTHSIRKVLADSVAFSLCRQQEAMLDHIKRSSINVADILSVVNKAELVVPKE